MPHVNQRTNIFLLIMVAGIFLLFVVMILLMTRPAWPSTSYDTGLPAGATCELVREKVAEHGKATALAWAIKQGYTFAQIRLARRCLTSK